MDEGKISYSSELSEKGFAEGASRIRQEVQGLTNSVEKSGKKIDSVYDKMSQKMKQAFAVGSLVAFQNEIIKVRGEMESLQISFETLAGKQVGKQLYEDIKQFAVNTPMMMGDLAKGAQTMLGFGISAEKIMPILKQLGDVSMGDSQRFNSLALSFSQMSATGKLMGQDLNQMINAGFNPLSEISKKTGKSIGQLKQEMENGAISVQMVEDAFRAATSEGGKFNGMLEKQSKGMAGAISNMKGAYEDMLNDMGEKEQGILVEGTKLATAMLQNYEAIGKVILQLIATYGSYKAAVIVVSAAEAVLNGQYVLKTRLLRAAAAAQALLNKTMLANPYVLVTTGVLSLISALVIFQNRTEELSESQKKLNDTFDDTQAKIASEQKNIDALFDKLRNAKKGTDEYKTAKDNILKQYGNYLKGLDNETATLKNVEKAYKAITKAAREAAMARGMETAMKDAQDTYGSAYAENIGKIQEALSKVGTDEASKALKQVQKELRTTGEVSEKTISKIHKLTDGEAKYGWFYNLNAAEQALEQQTKLVEERFAIDKEEEKIEETKQKRNKAVIEEEKKKLQAELENMNKSELQSKEGIAKKQKIAALEKELDEYNVSSSIKAGEKAADEQAKRNAKTVEQEQQFQDELTQIRQRAEDARSDVSLLSIKNNAERERAEREAQHQRNLRDIKAQEDEIYKAIYERRKASYENTTGKEYANTKAGKTGWQGVRGTLTDDEKAYYDERQALLSAQLDKENAEYSRYLSERSKMEAQSLLDYLKQYGSYQNQRLALAREYEQKIVDAGNDVIKKATVDQEYKDKLSQLDFKELQKSIDWESVFSELDRVSTKALSELKKKLENALDAKDITAENAKVISEKILDIENKMAERSSFWSSLIPALKERERLTNRVARAEEEVKKAQQEQFELSVKQQQYLSSVQNFASIHGKSFTQSELLSMTADDFASKLGLTGEAVEKAKSEFNNLVISTTELTEAQDKLTAAQLKQQNAQDILKVFSGSGSGIGSTIKSIFSNAVEANGGGTLGIANLINANAQSMAEFTDKIGLAGTDFGDAVHGFANSTQGFMSAVQSLANGDIFGALGGILDGFGGLADMIDSIGGGFLFGNDDEYQAALDKWGYVLDSWQENIEYERKLMEKAYGVKAIEATQKALEAAQKAAQAAQEIYEGLAGSGAGVFSHSNGYNINQDVDWSRLLQYDENLFKRIGGQVSSFTLFGNEFQQAQGDVANLFNLTWKELEELKNRAPQFWASIHSDAQAYLDQYIEAGKVAEETMEALREKLTTTSRANVLDDFLNTLYDIAEGSEDVTKAVADNWQAMVNRMVIDNLIFQDMQTSLESWYERLADLNNQRAEGLIDDEAYKRGLNALSKEYDGYLSDAQKKIEVYTEAGIIKPIEEATEVAVEETVRSLDTLRSAFGSLITDTELDAEEWAKNLRNTLITEFIESAVLGEAFDQWSEGWQTRLNNLLDQFSAGEIDENALNAQLLAMGQEFDAYVNDVTEKTKKYKEALGFKADEEQKEEEDGAFSGLRDTFLDTLSDMEGDAKSFRKSLEETMVKDLFEKQILDVPITVNGMSFDDFNSYVENWNERYKAAVADGNTAMLDSLLDELVQVREMTIEQAEELRKRLEEVAEVAEVAADTTFSEMSDNWVSTLMDMTKDAGDWAQEIGKTIAEKIIKEMVATSTIQPLLDSLQEQFNSAMSTGDTTSVVSAILPQLEQIKAAYPQLHEQVKSIMDALGLDTMMAEGFSDMGSIFIDSLTDLEADASTIGKNIAQNLLEQMLSQLVNSKYAEQMKSINEQWRKALESGDTKQIDDVRMAMLSLYDTIGNDSSIKKLADELKSLGEVAEEVAEEEISTPFDNLRDSFRSALMDMEMSAKDFAKSINQMIAEDFVNDFVMGDAFDTKLEEWKNRYKDITTDGNLTEEQRLTQLKQLGNLISQERDNLSSQTQEIMNMLGLGQHEDQTATMNMAEAATYDQFELYLGIATSHLMVAEQTKELVQQIVSSMQTIGGITSPTTNYAQQIFNRLGTTNEYLLETKKLVRNISEKIDTMNSHLAKL